MLRRLAGCRAVTLGFVDQYAGESATLRQQVAQELQKFVLSVVVASLVYDLLRQRETTCVDNGASAPLQRTQSSGLLFTRGLWSLVLVRL